MFLIFYDWFQIHTNYATMAYMPWQSNLPDAHGGCFVTVDEAVRISQGQINNLGQRDVQYRNILHGAAWVTGTGSERSYY